MKLQELYKHRTDFTIIGLTGRTGSGCTKIAELLSNDFENLKSEGLKSSDEIEKIQDPVFKRKYQIVFDYFNKTNNWVKFDILKYRDVLMLILFNKCGSNFNNYKKIICGYYDIEKSKGVDLDKLLKEIESFVDKNKTTLNSIKDLKNISLAKTTKLDLLHKFYFEDLVKILAPEFGEILEKYGYFERTLFFHYVACDIRTYGSPRFLKLKNEANIKNIYYIAEIINRIIKSRRKNNSGSKTKIVIDSLRNSLEIMFFKERFSGFYMLSTKDVIGNSRIRLEDRFKSKITDVRKINKLCDNLINLDITEYKTNDFIGGEFSSPDVENCIQKSDYHIINIKKNDLENEIYIPFSINDFCSREEQLMKFIATINHPGLITPSFIERTMQIAYSAKLNSGCTSRKVGAAIVDEFFSLRSIGWNDVAKGHTPCNLRSVNDFINDKNGVSNITDNVHYSDFEKGIETEDSSYKYKNRFPLNFKDAIVDYFEEFYDDNKMEGLNCSFCFKTIHNHYEGESNQVHTRSLHAEENAMLQLTKHGGTSTFKGFLFTTASPCELCSKKAYQLGINTVFYIDPYPGISNDQILRGGSNRPRLIAFTGAFGTAYSRLYEPYMATKDEISLLLDLKPKNKLSFQLNNILKDIDDEEIKKFVKIFKDSPDDEKVIKMIKKGIKK